MPTSIVTALVNIKKHRDNDLGKIVSITNQEQPRVNKEGAPFDAFIKDAFCNSFSIKDPNEKMKAYLNNFSYLGSQNNPPDIIIKGGDAVEVKKVKGIAGSTIALNSSSPKQNLRVDDEMITAECKNCEAWKEKDLVYCVGHVTGGKVSAIVFVYGDCYAADIETYKKVRRPIMEGLKNLKIQMSETRELARLNKVDPLQITDLRVRGMWQIKTPLKFFSDILKLEVGKQLSVFAIMKKEKFDSLEKADKEEAKKGLSIASIKIKNPDNPQRLIDAVLLSFAF
ncbi:NgoPII family restriction endonuclease [Candidatus Woesearchaeota archaeon]|nr:NgoPII family restriction endonuclease [Candidatus Woesearchaeota archaeon]